MKKNLLVLAAMFSMALAGCTSAPAKSSVPAPEPEPDNKVDVFVMSGQSNMEGSTQWKLSDGTEILKQYLDTREEVDQEAVFNTGFANVKTAHYGFNYPTKWGGANCNSIDQSTKESKLATPQFQPTKVGMGVADNPKGCYFGPELGIASALSEYATEENPVHLIKCAFSGSGFHKTDGPEWLSREDNPDKSLFYLLKQYTHNALNKIIEDGYEPVLRGFVWHQGESDSGSSTYASEMKQLIADFKTEFAEYAEDEDTDNIAFLDCTIYDGSKRTYGANPEVNNQKLSIANESEDDLNFIVDGSFNTENGLKLEIGDANKGGYNTYHYNASDAFRLGEAYGKIMIDNDLIRM